jgi:hypothetical protein
VKPPEDGGDEQCRCQAFQPVDEFSSYALALEIDVRRTLCDIPSMAATVAEDAHLGIIEKLPGVKPDVRVYLLRLSTERRISSAVVSTASFSLITLEELATVLYDTPSAAAICA